MVGAGFKPARAIRPCNICLCCPLYGQVCNPLLRVICYLRLAMRAVVSILFPVSRLVLLPAAFVLAGLALPEPEPVLAKLAPPPLELLAQVPPAARMPLFPLA